MTRQKYMRTFAFLLLSILLCSGCKDESPEEIAKIVKQLAGEAAGIPDDDFMRIATSGSTPRPYTYQSLTMAVVCHVVMNLPDGAYEDRHAELGFNSIAPDPNKIVKAIAPAEKGGVWTMLHSQYITDVTCVLDRGKAKGVITFDAEIYSGTVHYVARRKNEKWQIDEFSFPARDWRFARNEDNQWQWFDHFGLISKDRKIQGEKLKVSVTLDGESWQGLPAFHLKKYPEFSFYTRDSRNRNVGPRGEHGITLPAGEYTVVFQGKLDRGADPNWFERSKSDVTITIETGQTELNLDMVMRRQSSKE